MKKLGYREVSFVLLGLKVELYLAVGGGIMNIVETHRRSHLEDLKGYRK